MNEGRCQLRNRCGQQYAVNVFEMTPVLLANSRLGCLCAICLLRLIQRFTRLAMAKTKIELATMVPTIFLIEPSGAVKVSSMGFVKKDLEATARELAERRKMAPAALFRADESVPANKPG